MPMDFLPHSFQTSEVCYDERMLITFRERTVTASTAQLSSVKMNDCEIPTPSDQCISLLLIDIYNDTDKALDVQGNFN